LSFKFSDLASEFEFTISLGKDFAVAAGEAMGRGDIADGRVESDGIVMLNEALDEPSGILVGKRAARPEAIGFEALAPAFNFAVALRVIGRGFDMGQARRLVLLAPTSLPSAHDFPIPTEAGQHVQGCKWHIPIHTAFSAWVSCSGSH
jgi:hypothetical protein